MFAIILSGEIDIGVNIAERQYEKQILTKSNAIETRKFSVYGKKHPLPIIRRNLLKRQATQFLFCALHPHERVN